MISCVAPLFADRLDGRSRYDDLCYGPGERFPVWLDPDSRRQPRRLVSRRSKQRRRTATKRSVPGRLVAEAWMVPSLFDGTGDSRIIDEWTMGQYLGREAATARMAQHWATWITEGKSALGEMRRVLTADPHRRLRRDCFVRPQSRPHPRRLLVPRHQRRRTVSALLGFRDRTQTDADVSAATFKDLMPCAP